MILPICATPSATRAVEAAGFGGGGVDVEASLLGGEADATVVHHEAGDAEVALTAGVGKGGVVVAQTDELLERTHVLADVDELETGIARSGLFHFAAVGACLHHIDFNHGVKGV